MVVKRYQADFGVCRDALLAAIERRGLDLFARIDHAAGARSAGLELAAEEVIVFGDPRAGTPLMQSDPSVGLELPLRILVWSAGGATCLGYHDPRTLLQRYAIGEHEARVGRMSALLEDLVLEACPRALRQAPGRTDTGLI